MLNEISAAPPAWIDAFVTPEAKEKAISALQEGQFFIQIIAGGQATRMQDGLKALKVEGLGDEDYRIWNINIWDIIRKIKASDVQFSDPKFAALQNQLKSIEVPEFAKDYTAGQRNLFAISKGIENLPVGKEVQETIRKKLVILIHINNDIKDRVKEDLLEFNFFGFSPENVILVNGGYGG